MKNIYKVQRTAGQPTGLALLRQASRVRQSRGVTGHQGVDRSLDFITDNYRRPFRVVDLAVVAGLSRRGFLKAFKKHVGTRPVVLVSHARVEHAKRLLTESDWPLDVIAQQCGYRSRNTFWVAFRRTTGMAPEVFRRQEQQRRVSRQQ